jgi:16S rRNA (cytidine1402-2'-O)-methyltransferase
MKKAPHVHLVALPLGHPKDLGARAGSILESARFIFCEDTRKLQRLVQELGLQTRAKFVSLPGDEEWSASWDRFLEDADDTPIWALVSDAGTPIVNDPGKALLEHARRNEWRVTAVPGPCAPILAWQWSGGFGLPFSFVGFAPKAKGPGVKALEDFFAPLSSARSFVFFDTRHQVLTTLAHLEATGLGERRLYLAREMTKSHEELLEGSVRALRELLEKKLAADEGLGELTFVLEGAPAEASVQASTAASLEDLVEVRKGGAKAAAKIAARLSGRSVSDCYDAFHRGDD